MATASLVTIVRLLVVMVAVELSAIKVTSTVRLVPLMAAVTVLIPALVLVSVCTISPFASEMPVAAIVALLPALKLTLTPETGLPFASVTVALTLLVAVPLALALLSTGTRLPAARVAVALSAMKSASALLVLPPVEASTVTVPAWVLSTFTVALPLLSVTTCWVSVLPSG